MPWTRTTLVLALALVAVPTVLAAGSSGGVGAASSPTSDPGTLAGGCTDATEGQVLLPRLLPVEFVPPCVVVDDGDVVTFENRDEVPHDPGDGVNDGRERALCFQAGVDIEDERALPPGDTYSIQLRFEDEGETLYLEKAWHDGQRQDLNGEDEGRGTIECHDASWEWIDDDTIAVDYICHIHPETVQSVIRMNV